MKQAPAGRIRELADRGFRERWDELGGKPAACEPWRKGSGLSPAPIPVLVDTGGTSETDVSWHRQRIRKFVAFALPLARGRHPNWRSKPLLAVPFIGTGQGGQFQRKGEMAKAILFELSSLVSRDDFDAVLCVPDEAALAAAQQNRQPFGSDAIGDPARSQAEKLAEHARRGNLVLFLGAGISQQAGLPMWSELLQQLAADAGMSDDEKQALAKLPSLDAASVLELRLRSRGGVFGEVVAGATRSECFGLGHALAAGLPIRESVTTNYDDLFEMANEALGTPLAVLPYQPSSSANRWLLKLHGSVDRPEDIVLTRADFLRYENSRAALYGIVQAMLMTRHILFIGFSLTDDNFHRLADEVRLALDGRTRDPETKRRGSRVADLRSFRQASARTRWHPGHRFTCRSILVLKQDIGDSLFSWLPFYEELADRLLSWLGRAAE